MAAYRTMASVPGGRWVTHHMQSFGVPYKSSIAVGPTAGASATQTAGRCVQSFHRDPATRLG
jgi:hypothetical protein